jgi:hypothetical protein
MSFERFENAVQSMIGFPKMVGIMGGEPLLHPQFEKFCRYVAQFFPKEQLGLWSCFPKGFEKYRELICEVFGNIFLNDHTRADIYHAPLLVASEEVFPDKRTLFMLADHCWLQNSWSACINPNGAFFCEVAGSMSLLFKGSPGWSVEPGWWLRCGKDYGSQIEEYCVKCGCCLPLPRRSSMESVDDISPGNLERLKGLSIKVDRGAYVVSDLKITEKPEEMAAYKDQHFRDRIADRYGIFLSLNRLGFLTPYLKTNWTQEQIKPNVFQLIQKGIPPEEIINSEALSNV